jgi:hypothetical protein
MTHLSPVSTVQLSRPICRYIREYIGTVCCNVCACVYSLHVHYSHRTGPSFRIIAQSTAAAVACNIHTHIMQVKMEPNQRGYTVYTAHTNTHTIGFFVFH